MDGVVVMSHRIVGSNARATVDWPFCTVRMRPPPSNQSLPRPHETGRPALRVAREVKRGKEREESAPGHPFWVTHSSSSIVPVRAVTLSATAIDYTHTSKSGMLRAGGVGSAPSLPGPYYTRCYCARCSLTVRSLQLAGCSSYRDSLIKSSRFEHRVLSACTARPTRHSPHDPRWIVAIARTIVDTRSVRR